MPRALVLLMDDGPARRAIAHLEDERQVGPVLRKLYSGGLPRKTQIVARDAGDPSLGDVLARFRAGEALPIKAA